MSDPDTKDGIAERDSLQKLARMTLWLAYVWNDHNFPLAAHEYARQCAREVGIDSFDAANRMIDHD